jgi:hypothetical protein
VSVSACNKASNWSNVYPTLLPANFGAILTIVQNLLAIAQLSGNTFRYNHLQIALFFIHPPFNAREILWITNST